MSFFLLLLHLLLHLCVSAKQSRLEEAVKDDLEEIMCKTEKLDGTESIIEELESKLETKIVEVENLQTQLKEVKVQFAEIERKIEEVMLSSQNKDQNQEIACLKKQVADLEIKVDQGASLKSEMRAEVKKEVDEGLRDLPFEMVCAYKHEWTEANSYSVVRYDQITVEFNNSERPGGADGTMNIETGVFTTVTSGYYIVTYSAFVQVQAEEFTIMWLFHNGVKVEESGFHSSMHVGSGSDYGHDQGSRTVVSIVSDC